LTKGYNDKENQSSCSCSFASSPDQQDFFCQKAISLLPITCESGQGNGLLKMPSRINRMEIVNPTPMWRKTPAYQYATASVTLFSHIDNQKSLRTSLINNASDQPEKIKPLSRSETGLGFLL
tara:strand:+ start:628 stop:993 length:366 start_codon:yes stop_codon:yes gene_type:complete